MTDLDLTLKNITLRGDDWQSDDGSLAMNAGNFINGSFELNDPIVNAEFSPQGIQLTQFSSRWVNGVIRASGSWTRSDKRLTLDDLAIAGRNTRCRKTGAIAGRRCRAGWIACW